MAKKVDLEAAYRRNDELCRRAVQAETIGDLRAALRLSESCLALLRDALAYQRRYLPTALQPTFAVDRVLSLAPPLFAYRSLDALALYSESRTKAEIATLTDLPGRLIIARQVLSGAIRMWSTLNRAAGGATRNRSHPGE